MFTNLFTGVTGNVALLKPAKSSSIHPQEKITSSPNRGNDGLLSTTGDLFHTDFNTGGHWWMVDLGMIMMLKTMIVYGNPDCCRKYDTYRIHHHLRNLFFSRASYSLWLVVEYGIIFINYE